MTDKSQNIALLREEVERSANHRVKTSTDFAVLSGMIQERCHETVSTSTLKRIWGYVDGYANTRRLILDILSKFAGFPDFETFVSDYCEQEGVQSSHRVLGKSLYACELEQGVCIEVTWNPNRRCVFCYLGDSRFEVVESVNAKLKPNDTFECDRFTEHQPLYVSHLVQKGEDKGLFVIGNKGGLTTIKRLSSPACQ